MSVPSVRVVEFGTKTTERKTFRKITPTQHTTHLIPEYLQTADIDCTLDTTDTQLSFDHFYDIALQLLNTEPTITVTSRDPDYITPEIKAMLRRNNR